tara:strand:+ start:1382 stop:1489 length:108 start_codon:yes stop_codon:yes gene_type:complete
MRAWLDFSHIPLSLQPQWQNDEEREKPDNGEKHYG